MARTVREHRARHVAPHDLTDSNWDLLEPVLQRPVLADLKMAHPASPPSILSAVQVATVQAMAMVDYFRVADCD
jgi:hypothetical protein